MILDLDGMRLLARIFDGKGQNDEALELYETLRRSGWQRSHNHQTPQHHSFCAQATRKKLKRYQKKYGTEGEELPANAEPQLVENGLEANSTLGVPKNPEFANPGKITLFNYRK